MRPIPAALLFALTLWMPIQAEDAPARWRADYAGLTADTTNACREEILRLCSPVAHDQPADDLTPLLRALAVRIDALALAPGESLRFDSIHGPETPFPDHAVLAEISRQRLALVKLAWLDGDHTLAINRARQNLDFARAALDAQEGIIPLIAATGLWQTALDGAYWLARQPGLDDEAAAALQNRLHEDNGLAARALARAFRGEHEFVQKVVIERLPDTNDPELILSSIGSLGMVPATPPTEGEPRLPLADKKPLDPVATVRASADNIAPYLRAFAEQPGRNPVDVTLTEDLPARLRQAEELGPLLRYATMEELPTPELLTAAAEKITKLENSLGKLYLLIATPQWGPLCESVYRRQAQNSALQVLLAWRRAKAPADWDELSRRKLLDAPFPDPFAKAPLKIDAATARVWSVGPDGTDQGGDGDGENLGRPADLVWPAGASR